MLFVVVCNHSYYFVCLVAGSGLLSGCVVGGAERAVGGSLAQLILCCV